MTNADDAKKTSVWPVGKSRLYETNIDISVPSADVCLIARSAKGYSF